MFIELKLAGEGDVFLKKTKHRVGRYRYRLVLVRDAGGLAETVLDVEIDALSAHRLFSGSPVLTLRLESGQCQDFYVTSIAGDGSSVDVTASGSMYDEHGS